MKIKLVPPDYGIVTTMFVNSGDCLTIHENPYVLYYYRSTSSFRYVIDNKTRLDPVECGMKMIDNYPSVLDIVE